MYKGSTGDQERSDDGDGTEDRRILNPEGVYKGGSIGLKSVISKKK